MYNIHVIYSSLCNKLLLIVYLTVFVRYVPACDVFVQTSHSCLMALFDVLH